MINGNEYYKVYTRGNRSEELQEINPEVVFMTIPQEYVCIYRKLLVMLADFGIDLLNDCSATCKGNNKNIVNCWHMFMSAIAMHQLGKEKEANLLINYIKGQISLIYQQDGEHKEFDEMIVLPISEDGLLKSLISCGEDTKFYVDLETGELIQKGLDNNRVFTIEDNNLNNE